MQVEKGKRIESYLIGCLHQQFDGGLVIQDHLGFMNVFAGCDLSEFDEVLGIKTIIGISLQAGRGP